MSRIISNFLSIIHPTLTPHAPYMLRLVTTIIISLMVHTIIHDSNGLLIKPVILDSLLYRDYYVVVL